MGDFRDAGFSDASWRFVAVNDVDNDFRPLVVPHQRVIVEIALLDLPALEGNITAKCCCQTKDHTTLDLVAHNVRIDHLAITNGTERSHVSGRLVRRHPIAPG